MPAVVSLQRLGDRGNALPLQKVSALLWILEQFRTYSKIYNPSQNLQSTVYRQTLAKIYCFDKKPKMQSSNLQIYKKCSLKGFSRRIYSLQVTELKSLSVSRGLPLSHKIVLPSPLTFYKFSQTSKKILSLKQLTN